jgi:hypothetical protein
VTASVQAAKRVNRLGLLVRERSAAQVGDVYSESAASAETVDEAIDVFRFGEPDLPQKPEYGEIGLFSQHIPTASLASSFRPSRAAAAASQTKLGL